VKLCEAPPHQPRGGRITLHLRGRELAHQRVQREPAGFAARHQRLVAEGRQHPQRRQRHRLRRLVGEALDEDRQRRQHLLLLGAQQRP
jgi:hypothetical protein